MENISEIAIVGAGPYGLSIAAHLRAKGVSFRIFGVPMRTWRENMPAKMFLKSDGFASNLSEPQSSFTLKDFCEEQKIPYDDRTIPVRLETFIAYGASFQNRFVPGLEEKQVVTMESCPEGFRLTLEDGSNATARKVVLAVGISHFLHLPAQFAQLPREFVTHSSAHSSLDRFRSRKVTVIGAGASAMDIAALLDDVGAKVTVVARRQAISFHNPPSSKPRSLWQRVRNPSSGIGTGARSRFYTDAALLFHYFPERIRLRIVATHLGPAAGWAVKDRIVGRIPLVVGTRVESAAIRDGSVHLQLIKSDGTKSTHMTDHVIAATGYKVDLGRLAFIKEPLLARIRSVENTPILSSNFESSVPGLYFVGIAAANSFGPVLRFAFGTDFVAHRISKHLAKNRAAKS